LLGIDLAVAGVEIGLVLAFEDVVRNVHVEVGIDRQHPDVWEIGLPEPGHVVLAQIVGVDPLGESDDQAFDLGGVEAVAELEATHSVPVQCRRDRRPVGRVLERMALAPRHLLLTDLDLDGDDLQKSGRDSLEGLAGDLVSPGIRPQGVDRLQEAAGRLLDEIAPPRCGRTSTRICHPSWFRRSKANL
jgi:hypothetical protein